jgi:hypothetical protein
VSTWVKPGRTGGAARAIEVAVEDIAGGIAKIVLHGRFDTTEAVGIELVFNRIVTDIASSSTCRR